MAIQKSKHNILHVRGLIAELLRSDSDFDAFCIDHFRDVSAKFTNGMDRTQKENVLLVHASTLADVTEALRSRFPDAPIWHARSAQREIGHGVVSAARQFAHAMRPWVYAVTGAGALLFGFRGLLEKRSPPDSEHEQPTKTSPLPLMSTGCQALAIDDVWVVKPAVDSAEKQTTLDVRIRHKGVSTEAANVTRVAFLVLQKFTEKTAYQPSASYDLLILGNRSEAALAQRIVPGEIDRFLIRLGFTKDTAAFQYTGKLQFLYNGVCVVESDVISLSAATDHAPD